MSANPNDPSFSGDKAIVPGPGRQLREARESARLSLGEVAANLRLDKRTIRALEADGYDRLPAPIFVRGYLRGYARLLAMPPGPIIDAFDQQGFNPPPLVADISERPQVHSTDFPVRIVTYLIIMGLVILVLMWWNSQQFTPVLVFHNPGTPAGVQPEAEPDSLSPTTIRPHPRASATPETTAPNPRDTDLDIASSGPAALSATAATTIQASRAPSPRDMDPTATPEAEPRPDSKRETPLDAPAAAASVALQAPSAVITPDATAESEPVTGGRTDVTVAAIGNLTSTPVPESIETPVP